MVVSTVSQMSFMSSKNITDVWRELVLSAKKNLTSEEEHAENALNNALVV